ncbi:hypothetical protein [Ralstonia pseudosolanacearum]|uniref:hypothetical protein n=1 Tax=Ralstonia pseudosolanacearum TaxID=1310165 RepID=UPI00048BAA6F|nr:hypothetical protein [Ralstonia pseudosolanacearum]MDO3558292.1 hypothetical protein [Ralstonia pseudosolanacearum]MDO3575515.1 hypothetical protein [Ralstonia pseudosolanacearum]MDO3586887.1 hypothetical protein [Ralstonia pseudosolanacearum]
MNAATVQYFEMPEMPGRVYFACAPLRCTLSVDACVANWRASNEAGPVGGNVQCKRCSVGARHAGGVDANASPLRGTMTCARCHRSATRLIRQHICVSCFNREREAILGRNCKGSRPEKLTAEMLGQRAISYQAGGEVRTRVVERSVDTVEVMVAVLRDEKQAPRFGWRAPGLRRVQPQAA